MIQFTYGGDGLDPMMMEGVGKPVDFNRILNLVVHTEPARYTHQGFGFVKTQKIFEVSIAQFKDVNPLYIIK